MWRYGASFYGTCFSKDKLFCGEHSRGRRLFYPPQARPEWVEVDRGWRGGGSDCFFGGPALARQRLCFAIDCNFGYRAGGKSMEDDRWNIPPEYLPDWVADAMHGGGASGAALRIRGELPS